MIVNRGREQLYYSLLLAFWVLILGAYGPGIASAFGLMNNSLAYGVGGFVIMALLPVWAVVGLLVLIGSLAVLLVGSLPLRLRVITWMFVLVGLWFMSDELSKAGRGGASVGAVGLSLLGGLAIYWIRHPAARNGE